MLMQEFTNLKVSFVNGSRYEKLGYHLKKRLNQSGKESIADQMLTVRVQDLLPGAKAIVHLRCDICNKVFDRKNIDYYNQHKNGCLLDYCDHCARSVKGNNTKIDKYGTLNPKEIADQINGKVGRNIKNTIGDVRSACEKKNYTMICDLPDITPIRQRDDVSAICNIHNKEIHCSVASIMNMKQCNCDVCKNIKIADHNRQQSIDQAIEICEKKNYTLLSSELTCTDTPLEYVCNLHPEYGIQHTSLYGLKRYKNNCRMCKMPKGEDHWNWHGGIATQRDKDTESFEYRRFIKKVLKRDGYTCQCCGAYAKPLNVHHVLNYAKYPDLRTDPSNGITLCEQCHLENYEDSFHSLYGKYNNTKEQLQEYIDQKRKFLQLDSVNVDDILIKPIE